MNAITKIAIESRAPDDVLVNDWHVVGFSDEIAPGKIVPTTLLGEDLIIWRDAGGAAHVWKDLCIHRGARLSKGWIANDTVVCPYHGWRYDGSAQCVLVPSAPDQAPPERARAFSHPVMERYGFIWTTLGKPAHDVPVFPEWNDAGFRKFNTGPYDFHANGFRAVENFIDATHFPFVHSGLNGVEAAPDKIPDYRVFETPEGLCTSEIRVFQPYGDHRKIAVNAGYTYRCFRPLVAYFSKAVQIADPARRPEGSEDDRFCTFLTAQPVDEVNCIIRLCVAINFGPELTLEDIQRRQDTVFAQDKAIVETQRPERIPIHLRTEMHHRTDILGVAYRRWLRNLGVTYGAA